MVIGSLLALALAVPARASLPDAGFESMALQSARLLSDVLALPRAAMLEPGAGRAYGTRWDALAQEVRRAHPEVPAAALERLFGYLERHPAPNMRFAGLIDMDRPNSERRFFIINLADGSVESFLVAHGKGSGAGDTAERFSDRAQSHMTSLGVYLTGDEYDGKHGRSLTLLGQQPSNAEAESRSVVLHGAAYVSDEYLREHGRIGDSWGCPAVDFRYRDHIIDELGGGAALLIYHS